MAVEHGESICGTRGGPIAPADWGVATQKSDKVFVHVLNWHSPLLAIPPITGKIVEAHALVENAPVEFTQSVNGVVLKVLSGHSDGADRVVVLTLQTEN